MSREFGQYNGGYFHEQISMAAEDCEGGVYEITRKWGKVLRAMRDIAYAISTAEAGDSGDYYPIMESIRGMPDTWRALAEVEAYLRPFRDVAEEAIRDMADNPTAWAGK